MGHQGLDRGVVLAPSLGHDQINSTMSPGTNGSNDFSEMQPTALASMQQQIALFTKLPGFDREILKEAMAKTLENMISGEGSVRTCHRQPSRQPKRFRKKPIPKIESPYLEASMEMPAETGTQDQHQDEDMTVDNVVEVELVVEDAEKISAAQEDSLSDFEDITIIPDPPPTITPTR